MNINNETKISDLISVRNHQKFLFTAGPASLLSENILGLRPCFGRGDSDYTEVEQRVLAGLKNMTGHGHIVRLQGSASLALEIASLNFLEGRILVIDSGYYSGRLKLLSESAQKSLGYIKEVQICHWKNIDQISINYDWIVACYTETSRGIKLPIEKLHQYAKKCSAKLFIDATASIGLEPNHDLADVACYSSCKGLFGLTGAAFIAYHQTPNNEVNSFYLNIHTHLEKKVTGPYHALASLDEVLPNHQDFLQSVKTNKEIFCKKMATYLTQPKETQPNLCTHVSIQMQANSEKAVMYSPRDPLPGSIICHLGEAHLGANAKGEILQHLEIKA